MTDEGRKARGVVVLGDGAEIKSAAHMIADSTLNLLSLDGRHRFTGIQHRRYTIIRKNVWSYFSENVIGSEVSKNPT
jgi:hypothetical protein